MRVALPCENGRVTMHFGHAPRFMFYDVDAEKKMILRAEEISAPPHEPGALPQWLAQNGAEVVLAGGMGGRAQSLLNQQGITVVVGVPDGDPEQVVEQYLSGELSNGPNLCDH